MGSGASNREGQLLAGKYRLERLLGTGGMGEVYRAENTLVHRTVAIKLLLPEHAREGEVVARLLQEARAANAVRHPNVVDVLDMGQDDAGAPFIVQEYLEGQDLAMLLDELRGRLSLDAALDLLLPVIDAVGVAHASGVVHRDLKPSNVFLARVGDAIVPKVLDFGIAKVGGTALAHRVTGTGVALGTPAYMSPEVIQNGARNADARSDVWSIGVMLYEVLSGQLPFESEEVSALFVLVCTERPVPLERVAPHLPPGIVRVVSRCLQKRPDDRYASGAELARELRAATGRQDRDAGSRGGAPGLGGLVEAAARRASRRPPPPATQGPGRPLERARPRAIPLPEPQFEIDRFGSPPIALQSVPAPAFRRAPPESEPPEPLVRSDDVARVAGTFAVLVVGAVAAMLGPDAPDRASRAFGSSAAALLGVAGALLAAIGVAGLRRASLPSPARFGMLTGSVGALAYAAAVGASALRIGGLAPVPDLAGLVVPWALAAVGAGVAAAGGAWGLEAWRADRNGAVAALHAVCSVAGLALAAQSVASALGAR
jgi:serine/threonine-protein kinase